MAFTGLFGPGGAGYLPGKGPSASTPGPVAPKPKKPKNPNTPGSSRPSSTYHSQVPHSAPSRPATSSKPKTYQSSGGGGGGSSAPKVQAKVATTSVASPAIVPDPEPVAPKPPDLSQWYLTDPTFQAAYASDGQTRDSALADLATKRANYNNDFQTQAMNMGRTGVSVDDKGNVNAGSWNPKNALGAYGQGLQSLNNDYGSRGMMDSSFYGGALQNFNNGMDNQWNDAVNSRTQYMTDNGANSGQGAAANDAYNTAVSQAQADAAARYAAQYGLDPSKIPVTPYAPAKK